MFPEATKKLVRLAQVRQASSTTNDQRPTTNDQRPTTLRFRSRMPVHRAPRLVFCVADIFQGAIGTFWRAGNAQLAAMPDDLVRNENPLLTRDHIHQIFFDFLRVIILGQFQPPRDAMNMRVHDYTVGYFEPAA